MGQYVVIGAGQLGSRHLQSLSNAECSIWVYDPSENSLAIARSRLSETSQKAEVTFSSSFDSIPKVIDLAVVATNSDVRLSCVKQMVSISHVRNIILEKVLFNKMSDYAEARILFETRKINVWVNCPRRQWNVYKEIKAVKNVNSPVTVSVHAGEFGLASNAIHFLDIVNFLIPNETLREINLDGIDPEITNSKRNGFKEMTGTLRALFSSGSTLNLHFQKNSQSPICLLVTFDQLQFSINETHKKMIKFENLNIIEGNFETPFQSCLTLKVANQIMSSGNCELPTFLESINLHSILIGSFLKFMDKELNEVCPVT